MTDPYSFEIPTYSHLAGDQKYVTQITRVFQNHYNSQLPSSLWHYTSAETFLKILTSQEIWFTHVSAHKDEAEVAYAIWMMKATLETGLKRLDYTARIKTLLSTALTRMAKDNSKSSWFTASFTGLADSSYHWKTYGNNLEGVAICFNSQELIRFFSASPTDRIGVVESIYDTQHNLNFCGKLLAMALLNFEEDYSHISDDQIAAENFLGSWGKHADFFSIMPKLQTFASEKEWRFARQFRYETGQSEEDFQRKITEKYWPTGRGKLSDSEHANLPIVGVKFGQSCSSESKNAIINLLKTQNYSNLQFSDATV
jgi:hypothetical protein